VLDKQITGRYYVVHVTQWQQYVLNVVA